MQKESKSQSQIIRGISKILQPKFTIPKTDKKKSAASSFSAAHTASSAVKGGGFSGTGGATGAAAHQYHLADIKAEPIGTMTPELHKTVEARVRHIYVNFVVIVVSNGSTCTL